MKECRACHERLTVDDADFYEGLCTVCAYAAEADDDLVRAQEVYDEYMRDSAGSVRVEDLRKELKI